MDDLEEIKKTFFEESTDLLSAAEGKLASLSPENARPEILGAIFRAVHSIKGGAGAFGFERLVKFAHAFENVLDALRSGKIKLGADHHALLVQGFDVIWDLVRNAETGGNLPVDREQPVLEALRDWYPPEGAPAAGNVTGATTYIIRFKPHRALFQRAQEPALLLRELSQLGRADIACITGAVPALQRMDPEEAYLGWIIQLETRKDEAAIREVFEFAQQDCDLIIEKQLAPARLLERPPVESIKLETPRVENPVIAEKSVETISSIRVDLEKIERLFNMVGEITVNQTMIAQQVSGYTLDNRKLRAGLEAMRQHTRELQDSVLSIRAQPVKTIFQRMPRLARELAFALKKEVQLEMTGEDTEIDRSVIEHLSSPIMHMIRNAIDHGIELPLHREAAGKPRSGTIRLSAEHRSGRMVIEVQDDGIGIDRARVKRKSIEWGLIDPAASVAEEEIDGFIFLPGFSTADKVSDVSGRGVGMDVVSKNIQDLGGRVTVQSTPGEGTRFIMSLPLTLTVLDGMLVKTGDERYVVPVDSIAELVKPAPEDLIANDLLQTRGGPVRLLYLHKAFGIDGAVQDALEARVIVSELEDGQKIGIVVDGVIGPLQAVIKSVEQNYGAIEGVAAATILGDGCVAFILDVESLRQMLPASSLFARVAL